MNKRGSLHLLAEAYQQVIEKQVQAQLDEGVLNKIGSMALGLVLSLSNVNAANIMYAYQDAATQELTIATTLDKIPANAIVRFKIDTDSETVSVLKGDQETPIQVQPAVVQQTQKQASKQAVTPQTQNSPNAKGIIYQNDGWTAVKRNSKTGCLIISKTNKNVQVSVDKDGTTTINVSFKDRGGVEMYRYLVDRGRTPLQPGIDQQSVSNPNEVIKIPFDQAIQEGTRLTVMVVSPQGKGNTDTIDIGSLKDAVRACQKAMAQ